MIKYLSRMPGTLSLVLSSANKAKRKEGGWGGGREGQREGGRGIKEHFSRVNFM